MYHISEIFKFGVTCFLIGVWSACFLYFEQEVTISARLLLVGGFLLTVLFFIWWRLGRFVQNSFKIFLLILISFISGSWYVYARISFYIPSGFEKFYDRDISFIGKIIDEPERKIDRLNVVVKPNVFFDDEATGELNFSRGYILIKVDRYEDYEYGDRILVNCRLRKPERIKDFDYRAYLFRYHVFATCSFPKISQLSQSETSSLFGALYRIKVFFISILNRYVHEPYSSFAAGVLLGARQGIDPQLSRASTLVGVTHILAVSGYNVAIVVKYLLSSLYFFGIKRNRSYFLSFIGIVFFVIMTGASASVVRAGIMGGVVLLTRILGRRSGGISLLLLVAFLMVTHNPFILYSDLGFQLSFASTAGLIIFSEFFYRRVVFVPETFGLRECVATTIAAMIFTTPLIVYNFGRFSLIAIIANLLIVPLVPYCMIITLLVCFGGMIGVGSIIGGLLSLLLIWCVWIIETLAQVPYASIELNKNLFFPMVVIMSLFFFGGKGFRKFVGSKK